MFKSPGLLNRLKPFTDPFRLLLDIAIGPQNFIPQVNVIQTNQIARSHLTHLTNLEFIKKFNFIGEPRLLPAGEAYIREVGNCDPTRLLPSAFYNWGTAMLWTELLLGIDEPLCGVVHSRWNKIRMCNSGGYTNQRGDRLLTLVFENFFDESVNAVIELFYTNTYSEHTEMLCYKYMARKLPYERWINYLTHYDPQHIQDDKKRTSALKLFREVKKL